jgi:protein involved in polysaccharide export with SLBB domain
VKLFKENDPTYDTVLEDGDQINIPTQHEFVHIMGAVQQPGYMSIEPGSDYMYYIEKAGGFNWNANESRVRIVKAQTGQRFKAARKVNIEGGDTINVPEKKPIDIWAITKDSVQVFANMATIIILAKQIAK